MTVASRRNPNGARAALKIPTTQSGIILEHDLLYLNRGHFFTYLT
jgi:hypothetical protein